MSGTGSNLLGINYMIKCIKCNITKNVLEFYKRLDRIDEYHSYCKECFNTFCKERWKSRKVEAINKMGNRCYDCKISYPSYIYDFHHLDPSKKDFTWNRLRQMSQSKIDKELSKCVLLCSNCHRKRHYS